LFDLIKLQNISKDFIAKMTAKEASEMASQWALEYEPALEKIMNKDREYLEKIFNIERGLNHQRKDIAKWSDIKEEFGYFYEEIFEQKEIAWPKLLPGIEIADIKAVLENFSQTYEPADNQEQWFDKVKEIAVGLGYAPDLKTYKKDQQNYKGYVADIAKILRVFLTGKIVSPNLYEIMQTMGDKIVLSRLKNGIKCL